MSHPSPPAARRRTRLLDSGGGVALAALLALGGPVQAQSFQGSASVAGNATVSTSTNHTQIDVSGDRAIITWSPTDSATNTSAAVNFQPAGTSATFSSAASGLTDFTVLNIVNAPGSRVIALNGSIDSKVSNGAGGAVTGGTVWFYSSNGFFVGSGARFDVGSLLLTANRPEGIDDPTSPDGLNHAFDTSTQRLTIEPGHSGTIEIAAGAQINASNYVALVAPHIVQGGAVRAAGEIAYVGAESVDMTMPVASGLFGISVVTGTDGTAITHTGTSGGPAAQSTGQKRNIYFVTMPKNDAVTMLLGGTIGYDTTLAASQLSDGTILLAGAGASVAGGQITSPSNPDGIAATIVADGAQFTNKVVAHGSSITLDATGPLIVAQAIATTGDLAIATDGLLTLAYGTAVGAVTIDSSASNLLIGTLGAGSGATLTASGSIGVTSAAVSGDFSATGASIAITGSNALALTNVVATSGNVALAAFNGTLDVGHLSTPGTANLYASGTVTANDITAPGGVTARGTTLALGSTGALTLTSATAITGTLTATAGGDLVLTSGTAGDQIALTSSGGSVTIGSATSGTTLSADAATTVGFQTLSADAITLRARGGAITGSSIAANGAVTLQASDAVAVDDLTGSAASSADGSSVTIGSSGALSLAHVGATNGDITLHSNGDLTLAQANATGAIALQSATGAVTAAGLATGATGVSAQGTAVSLAGSGALTVANAVATAGAVTLGSVNDLTVTAATASGAFSATSSAGSITAGTVTSGGALSLAAAKAASFGTLTGGSLDLSAAGGALSGTTLATTGTARLRASGAVAVTGDLAAGGGADIQGASVAISAAAPLTVTNAVATAGDLAITDAGDLTVAAASATGSARLASSGGAVHLTNASIGTGDLAVTAATTATLDGTITAGGAIGVTAADANVTGSLTGRTIAFATKSIEIGSAARIGLAGTTSSVTFTNTGTQRSYIGGTSGNGYLLTAAGLGRVQADAIAINLPAVSGGSAANPDVTIGDLTLHGSTGTASGTLANLTSNGGLTITTPGTVRVSGTVSLTDIGAGNSLKIAAGPEIDVVTPSGAILLTNSAGTATGSLDLGAQRILVATQSALDDLNAITDTTARNARLAMTDGVTSDQGFLAANRLTFRIATTLDIQNSGGTASADRRGITAGSGGVDVVVSGGGSPEVIINGRQIDSAGGQLTSQVRITAADGGATPILAVGSNVNACTLGLVNCGALDIAALLTLVGPQQDVVGMLSDGGSDNNDKKSGDSGKRPPRIVAPQPLMVFPRPSAAGVHIMIDEPVIGVPNDDLWIDPPMRAPIPSSTGVN